MFSIHTKVGNVSPLVQTEISHKLLDGFPWDLALDIHGFKRMNPTDFCNPMNFPLVPPVGQCFFLLTLWNISSPSWWTESDTHCWWILTMLALTFFLVPPWGWHVSTTECCVCGTHIHVPVRMDCNHLTWCLKEKLHQIYTKFVNRFWWVLLYM